MLEYGATLCNSFSGNTLGLSPQKKSIGDTAKDFGKWYWPETLSVLMDEVLITIDSNYLRQQLLALLEIPSPLGHTDSIVEYLKIQLQALSVPWQMARRGTLIGVFPGKNNQHRRALAAHVDTLGVMVREVCDSGRLKITPLGSWSARFAEGGRVTLFADGTCYRGTILPIKSSGHVYGDDIDRLAVSWHNVELRIDAACNSGSDARDLGIQVGAIGALDPTTEWLDNGYVVSRYLDDKAGIACLLTAIKSLRDAGVDELAVPCQLLFTLAEEVGCGCGHVPAADVDEMVSIDIGPVAPGQNSSEHCVNIGIKDASGVYDAKLVGHLKSLCHQHGIRYRPDVYEFYRSDTHSAITAGADLRHALIAFGTESTHGYERTHVDSLLSTSQLLVAYLQSSKGDG